MFSCACIPDVMLSIFQVRRATPLAKRVAGGKALPTASSSPRSTALPSATRADASDPTLENAATCSAPEVARDPRKPSAWYVFIPFFNN